MSKAGQHTFTGISDQTDITLLYLLQGIKRNDFFKIVVEGKGWDDFTLVFKDSFEDYEVKSYSKPLPFGDIKRIIAKKSNKQYGKKDKFNIIVRKLSQDFKNCHEYVHEYIHWIEAKKFKRDYVVSKLLKKGWTVADISFLAKTEIIEFGKIENIHQKISEYFAFKYPFYLDLEDQKNIVARFFKDILQKGKSGGAITQSEFNTALLAFENHIADQPTSFSPTLSIGRKIFNLKDEFLCDSMKFKNLNHKTYLNQLTAHPRLIFYLCDELEKNTFAVDVFSFFVEKVLLKECYIQLAIRILKKKWSQDKVTSDYLINFVIKNYKKMSYDFNYDEALGILKEIAQKDIQGRFQGEVIAFLEKDILRPFEKGKKRRLEKEKRGWREDEHVAGILKVFLERSKNKKKFINFIFKYFDFTSDDFDNVTETHPLVYSFVKEFIKDNLLQNFRYVIRKVSDQFNAEYNGKYKGYEWIGSSVSQSGSNYSITDKGVVRLLFQPLFFDLYKKNTKDSWLFFKKNILEKTKKSASRDNPAYLKRALISILFERLIDKNLSKKDKEKAFYYLENILWIKKGIPATSEVVFYALRSSNLEQIGFDKIMKLINIDSVKYRRKGHPAGYPTSLFTISVLIKLIKLGYQPAKNYFLDLIKKPNFIKYDTRNYDSFELLVAEGIPESDPDFIVELFSVFDFEKYLNTFDRDFVWDKSGLITGLIKRDWKDNTSRGQQIVAALLKDKAPGAKVLEFLAGPIRDLSQTDVTKAYNLFSPYLQNKSIFWNTFQNNSYARESIVGMAEDLVKNKQYDEAKRIVELCIDDPDPDTDSKSEFNYHLKIKKGEKESLITSVRGKVAWVLQKFVVSNELELMVYAFEKIKILMDIDGSLAKRLNYSEPDLYVRKESLVPFIELAHPWRRKKLNEYRAGLGDEVKKLAFQLMRGLDEQFQSGLANPKDLVEYLLHVFSHIRDLSMDNAKVVLGFFEAREETHAHFLFTYFAEFIEDLGFDKSYFKNKLKELCSNDNPFKETFAWEFWRIADEDAEKKTDNFPRIEQYWKLLFDKYHARTFDNIYRALDITLNWPKKYSEHKDLFKRALETEVAFYSTAKQPAQLWEPGSETFQIFFKHSIDDFLEVLLFLLEKIQQANNAGGNVHYFFMRHWINIFKSLKGMTAAQQAISDKVQVLLDALYPEYAVAT